MEENHLHCRTEVNGDEDRRKVALITGITGTRFSIFTIFTFFCLTCVLNFYKWEMGAVGCG